MKKSWMPAALMGCLMIGYLAGSRRGSDAERSPPAPVPPAASAIAPSPAAAVDPPLTQPPAVPIPSPAPDEGLSEYPAWNGVDLDCGDVRRRVRVNGRDPHRLDHDGNGIGCESY